MFVSIEDIYYTIVQGGLSLNNLGKLLTVIRGNFGRISIILPNQLSNTNLLVVFLAVIMLASVKTNFSAINFVY